MKELITVYSTKTFPENIQKIAIKLEANGIEAFTVNFRQEKQVAVKKDDMVRAFEIVSDFLHNDIVQELEKFSEDLLQFKQKHNKSLWQLCISFFNRKM